jgi:hypothetical protein
MSRLGVENAAAQSFSRFLTVVTWSPILYIAHNAVLWFYVGRWWIYIPLAFAGFGSLLITMFQASSIFVLSLLQRRIYVGLCWPSLRRLGLGRRTTTGILRISLDTSPLQLSHESLLLLTRASLAAGDIPPCAISHPGHVYVFDVPESWCR